MIITIAAATLMSAVQFTPRRSIRTDVPSVLARAPRVSLSVISMTRVGCSIGATGELAARLRPRSASNWVATATGSSPTAVAMLLRWPRA